MDINIETKKSNTLTTPLAIVFAGILIAGAVLYIGVSGKSTPKDPQAEAQQLLLQEMRPVSDADHIRGSKDAPVVIVEYSDTECPFCKQFHSTLKQVVDEMGGQVAWVYRHFPLDALHSKARTEAVATECAADLGGEDMFWKYIDKLYFTTNSNDSLDSAQLPKMAGDLGLDVTAFNACLKSGKFDAKVEADVQNAIATGGDGTPWNIIIGKNDKKYLVKGAMQPAQLKAMIKNAAEGK